MTSFWSLWVIILTSLTIVLITWILFANRARENPEAKTTGHVFDGIEEYDNPMPAWWFLTINRRSVIHPGRRATFAGWVTTTRPLPRQW